MIEPKNVKGKEPASHKLTEEQLKTLHGMVPKGCYNLLLICGPDGTGIDTTIPKHQVVRFLQETTASLIEAQAAEEL